MLAQGWVVDGGAGRSHHSALRVARLASIWAWPRFGLLLGRPLRHEEELLLLWDKLGEHVRNH
jgi:hypothetical protein